MEQIFFFVEQLTLILNSSNFITRMKKTGNILIVDDNKSVLNSLQLFLKQHFEELVICSNPNQIFGLINEFNFDVVLLDMNFSAGINNGNEGLFWLKEILKN